MPVATFQPKTFGTWASTLSALSSIVCSRSGSSLVGSQFSTRPISLCAFFDDDANVANCPEGSDILSTASIRELLRRASSSTLTWSNAVPQYMDKESLQVLLAA